jgi:hypothetical protein
MHKIPFMPLEMSDPLILLSTALAVNVIWSLLVGNGDLKQWP